MSTKKPPMSELRAGVLAKAEEYNDDTLRWIGENLRRVSHGRRAKAKVQVTDELMDVIRTYAREHWPTESMWEIGVRFGVNQGRVSEALFGMRGKA